MTQFQETLDAISIRFDTQLERDLFNLLEKAQLTIAVSEFVTGGSLLSKLTRLSHHSPLILGGVVGSTPAMQVNFGDVSASHIRQYGMQSREGVMALVKSISDRTLANISIATSGQIQFLPEMGPHYCKADIWVGYLFLGQEKLDHVVLEGDDANVRMKVVQSVLMKLKGWFTHYIAKNPQQKGEL